MNGRDQKASFLLLSPSARCIRRFEAWILWTLLLKSTLTLQTVMVTLCCVTYYSQS